MHGTSRGSRSSFLSLGSKSFGRGMLVFGLFLAGTFGALEAQIQEAPAEVIKLVEEPAPPKQDVEKKEAPAKAEEAKKETKKQEAPANPINNLIRGIFGGGKPERIIPQNPENEKPPGSVKEPANGDQAARDRIDARAPYDPQMAKLLRQAATHIQEAKATGEDQKWNLAQKVLEHVLDPARPTKTGQPVEDALVRGADGKWTTMRQEANRLLAEFPPGQLAAYRQSFGGVADKMFKDAITHGDIDQVVTVASQFFHTQAGADAANWMGMRHFDHGEFGMAARWFRQLTKQNIPVTKTLQWQLKAAVTFHQAGDQKSSEELLALLEDHSLTFAGKTLTPREFIAQLSANESAIPNLDDWPVLYGSASHLGKAQGGDPLLLPRWSEPISSSHNIIERVEELVSDLSDEQYATVPAFTPIMVNGKAIFRTLRGVRVTDVETGQALWETRPGIAPESLITGVDNVHTDYLMQQAWAGGGMAYDSSGSGVDNNRLTSLLFRDGTWGGISSDGEQLFVLEDHAVLLPYDPGNYWAIQNGINDTHRRDYATNKIVSYNIETGRPRWEIGGTAMDEPFDRRLAGQYFFGVPVADQDELFAISEKDNEIRLQVLEKDTGRPKWSQLVAYSDAKIDRDFGRRWWNAQVGVGQGVVVCPTTVGWLVAVDRLNRSVLWVHRYSKQMAEEQNHNFNGQDQNLVPATTLNQVWGPSAPIIAGHRVVYTPPEDQTMICLDLFTGEKLWSKQKEDHLYLAGVFDGQVILVGKSKVSSISLESGSTLWTLPLTEDDGKPCGMGVAVGNAYHLPLSSGQLWTLDLSNGKVKTKSELADGLAPLGNLGMYRGMLLSLGPMGLTAFSQQQAIEAEILARRNKNPSDAWALLFEANIHTLKREFEPALELLRKVQPDQLSLAHQKRHRELMMDSLSALIRADYKSRDAEYAELESFAKSAEERLKFRRLTADRLRARGEFQAAFDEYLSLAETNGQMQMTRDDDQRVTLSMDRWLSGRLEQLWREVSGDDRARLDEGIAAAAVAVQSQGTLEAQRFLVLFGFHPQAAGVRKSLVEEYALAGEVALAENQLLKLTRNPDGQIAAEAWIRLARLFSDQGMSRDANYYYHRLQARYPKTVLADGKLVSDYLEELKAAGKFGSVAALPVAWSDAKIDEVRTGTNYSYYGNAEHDLQYTPYRLPYFQDRRFHFYQGHQRLGIAKASTDEMEWLVPLKRNLTNSQGNFMQSDTSGHVLFVVHSGILHALSPVDRKVLWTQSLDPKSNNNVYYNGNATTAQPMQRGDQFSPYNFLEQEDRRRNTTLAVVNSDYVCVLGRRTLSVHDAITGQLRWSKDRLPTQARVYGTDSLVFIVPPDINNTQIHDSIDGSLVIDVPPDGNKIQAHRSIDGSRVDVPKVGANIARTMRILAEGFIMAEKKASNSILGLAAARSPSATITPRKTATFGAWITPAARICA